MVSKYTYHFLMCDIRGELVNDRPDRKQKSSWTCERNITMKGENNPKLPVDGFIGAKPSNLGSFW